jgi:apolipoprotein N-acyltransferase
VLILLAILSGVLLGLSQPLVIAAISSRPLDPSGLTGLLALVGYLPLLWALRVSRRQPLRSAVRSAIGLGFLTSLVQIVIICHWTVIAFTHYAGMSFPVGLAAGMAIAVTLSLSVGVIGFGGSALLERALGWPAWLSFPIALSAAELFRNEAPYGGDPWGNVGMSMATIGLLRQGASLVGVYGLVFVVALINAVLFELLWARRSGSPMPRRAAISALSVGALWLAWGALRLGGAEGPSDRLKIGVLQGAIDQRIVNDPKADARAIRGLYQELQTSALAAGAELIIWPEAAFVPALDREIRDLAPAGATSTATPGRAPAAAVVGAMTVFSAPDEDGRPAPAVNETAFITGPGFEVRGRLTKGHLVPFGEYIPWPFQALGERLVYTPFSLLPGTEREPVVVTMPFGSLSIGGTICYEGIFPENSRVFVARGARLLLNLTNDAWFGVSSGPYQHALMYSMRATENGRPLVRAANAGVSAWFDTRGRMMVSTALFERTTLLAEVPVPKAGAAETTPYTLLGEWVAVLSWLVLVCGLSKVGFRWLRDARQGWLNG